MLNRPKISCNMLISLDGKIIHNDLNTKEIEFARDWYEEINCEAFSSFMCDKQKMEENFTKSYYPNLKDFKNTNIEFEDFITYEHGKNFAIAIDPYGELGWKEFEIDDNRLSYNGKPIIEVLTKKAPKEYLAYLRSINLNYIICGDEELDLKLALKKLYHTYGVKKIILEGNSVITSLFMNMNLIDNIELTIIPFVLGDNSESIFTSENITQFELDATYSKKDIVYIKYYNNNNSTYNIKVNNKELNDLLKMESNILKNAKELPVTFDQAMNIFKLTPSKIEYKQAINYDGEFTFIKSEKELVNPIFLNYLPTITNLKEADFKNILARKLIVVLNKEHQQLNFVKPQYLERFSDEKYQVLTILEFLTNQLTALDIDNPKQIHKKNSLIY